MAKYLQQLLHAREPLFSHMIHQLETATGNRGVDVAYLADVTERAHEVMRRIGLDTADTTAMELYRSLNAHASDQALFTHTDDVALLLNNEVVSFNHDDILENKSLTFEKRTLAHVRCQMQHGLLARYIATERIDEMAAEELIAQSGMAICDMGDYHEHKQTERAQREKVPYVLCIGDIFTDIFIKLIQSEAHVTTDKDGAKWLNIPFGSKPPYDRADPIYSVGPSPNAGVSLARLGLRVGLMSWLGNDQVGKDSLVYLSHEHIDTAPMVTQKNTASNTYYVLRYGADRTILVKDEDFDYSWKTPKTKPDWVYLSLISENSWKLHQQLLDYLHDNPEIKFAFQPGTFHFKWGAKKLAKFYKRAEIVVMNREEAADVTGEPLDSLSGLANALHALGPKYVVITDGPSGSYASFDGHMVTIPNYPDPAPPLDRTGAGDAFASTIVGALALGESMESALTWAPINSMSVVQQLGAQAGLLTKEKIEGYLQDAPKSYQVKELNE